MGDQPTDALWGIGSKTSRKLADIGLANSGRARGGRRIDARVSVRSEDGSVAAPARDRRGAGRR